MHVLRYDASGSQVTDKHRLLSYVVAEVELDGHRYALSAGQWFAVDESFVDKVDRAIRALDDLPDELALDPWKRGAHGEGDYNAQLAGTRNWSLLDKKNFQLPAS